MISTTLRVSAPISGTHRTPPRYRNDSAPPPASRALDVETTGPQPKAQELPLAKLAALMGPNRALAIFNDTLRQIGLRELRTADDRLLFGHALLTHGGVLEAVGRAIKIQAILHGAKTTDQ